MKICGFSFLSLCFYFQQYAEENEDKFYTKFTVFSPQHSIILYYNHKENKIWSKSSHLNMNPS